VVPLPCNGSSSSWGRTLCPRAGRLSGSFNATGLSANNSTNSAVLPFVPWWPSASIRCTNWIGGQLTMPCYKTLVKKGNDVLLSIRRSEFRQPSRSWCHSYKALRNRGWIFPSYAPWLNAEKFARSDVEVALH
jgi:hypothetical protein